MEKNTSDNTVIPAELVCDRRDEEKMLNWLLGNMEIATDRLNEMFETDEEPSYAEETIRITINGYHHDFILGGPQYDALYKFCEWIANANGYGLNSNE